MKLCRGRIYASLELRPRSASTVPAVVDGTLTGGRKGRLYRQVLMKLCRGRIYASRELRPRSASSVPAVVVGNLTGG